MSTTTPTAEESIDAEPTVDPRTRRACEGCMVTVPEGDGSGRFDVYSANDGHNEIYTVDLRAETCDCADHEHRRPAGGCKHIRRVKLGLGIMDLPAAPDGIELDDVLASDREKYGVDVEYNVLVDAQTPDSSGQETGAAVTDGGQLLEAEPEITGPHMEPAELSNATTFWRCEDCGRESIREKDTERAAFHAAGCSQR